MNNDQPPDEATTPRLVIGSIATIAGAGVAGICAIRLIYKVLDAWVVPYLKTQSELTLLLFFLAIGVVLAIIGLVIIPNA